MPDLNGDQIYWVVFGVSIFFLNLFSIALITRCFIFINRALKPHGKVIGWGQFINANLKPEGIMDDDVEAFAPEQAMILRRIKWFNRAALAYSAVGFVVGVALF